MTETTLPTFLRDPEPREVNYTLISVDDHLVEPPTMFEGRLPARLQDRAPRVVEVEPGTYFAHPFSGNKEVGSDTKRVHAWLYDDELYTQVGLNAVAGYDKSDYRTLRLEPGRFDEMRPGCYDIHARIRDMDIGGIYASLNFPSLISGFCGRVFARTKDPELGLAVLRAWNDWLYEEWWQPYPTRIIPMGLTWLADPVVGAEEIRRNAARGFVAVTFPEVPARIGLPSIFTDYWDPIFQACQETNTVLCLHVGSSGVLPLDPDAPEAEIRTTEFPVVSLLATIDWVWSGVPVRFPNLKISMAEGGIGWVPMLIDRLDYISTRTGEAGTVEWRKAIAPSDVLRRNFFFCSLDDPSTLRCRDVIGIDHIMLEVDYPHADTTWPDTQPVLKKSLASLPVEDIRKIAHGNAARLFRHPLPDHCLP